MPSIPTLVMAASSVTITPKAASKMGVDMRIVARTSVKVNTSESLNNFRPSLPVGDAPPDDNDGLGAANKMITAIIPMSSRGMPVKRSIPTAPDLRAARKKATRGRAFRLLRAKRATMMPSKPRLLEKLSRK